LIDRFLEKKNTPRKYLQLVGVTALFVAAKYEEIHPPQVADLAYVTDKAYTREDIVKMEVCMLTNLDFKVCDSTPMHFLHRYQSLNGCSESHSCLAQYLLELSLPDYSMLRFGASCRAASAVYLSNKLLRQQPAWNSALSKQSNYSEAMIKECAKAMCGLLEIADTNPLQAVRKKFSLLKYHSVAKMSFTGAAQGQTAEEPRSNVPRRSFAGERPFLSERRRSVSGMEAGSTSTFI